MYNQNIGFVQGNQPYCLLSNQPYSGGAPLNFYLHPPPQMQQQYNYDPCMQQIYQRPPPMVNNNNYAMPYPGNYYQRFQAPPPPIPHQQQSVRFMPAAQTYAPPKQRFTLSAPAQKPKQQPQAAPAPLVKESNDLLAIQLHSDKSGHDKERCVICRKATIELLRLPKLSDFLPKSYEAQLDEFKPFTSDLMLYSKPLQKPIETSRFQFARNQRFSQESFMDTFDESWFNANEFKSIEDSLKKSQQECVTSKQEKDNYSNSSTIDCEENQDAQSLASCNSPVNNRKKQLHFSTPISSASKDIMAAWKTPVVIDPSASPSYDQVFPSLSLNEKKHQKTVLRYNPACYATPIGAHCVFCKNNNETPEIYFTHTVKDFTTGVTTCPILRKYKCTFCKATGDNAHTRSHCPQMSIALDDVNNRIIIKGPNW